MNSMQWPKSLGEQGYFTSTMHANNKSFWNRDIMYDAIGYDYFYSATDYEITPKKFGWLGYEGYSISLNNPLIL